MKRNNKPSLLISFCFILTIFLNVHTQKARSQMYPPAGGTPVTTAYQDQYLCESCSSGLVCHDLLPSPPVHGTCVQNCRYCAGRFCQLCYSNSNPYPPCYPLNIACRTNSQCCGYTKGGAICESFTGTCKAPSGKVCYKPNECVRGYTCLNNRCIPAAGAQSGPGPYNPPPPAGNPPGTSCNQRLANTYRQIYLWEKQNYELLQIILRYLRTNYPDKGAADLISYTYILQDKGISANELYNLNTPAYSSPPTDQSNTFSQQALVSNCYELLRDARQQLDDLKQDNKTLMRIIQVMFQPETLPYGGQRNQPQVLPPPQNTRGRSNRGGDLSDFDSREPLLYAAAVLISPENNSTEAYESSDTSSPSSPFSPSPSSPFPSRSSPSNETRSMRLTKVTTLDGQGRPADDIFAAIQNFQREQRVNLTELSDKKDSGN